MPQQFTDMSHREGRSGMKNQMEYSNKTKNRNDVQMATATKSETEEKRYQLGVPTIKRTHSITKKG
jgi:hypothetical protein